ncbi:MAG: hypothetical protein WBG48_03330 [Pricia sp.]
MNHFFYLFIGFMLAPQIYGQDTISFIDVPEKSPNKISTSGFSYPMFINGEIHSEFAVAYPINEKLEAELQGFYDTYILANVTRFVLRGKYYVTKKLYSFAGMAAELEQSKRDGSLLPPRFFLQSGMGYDVNEKINLELKHEVQFNKADPGIYGIPSSFSARGKYKF